ncbi:hypothetical protein NQ317_001505 [Molorchus minor]|uniref:Uncharacterized protein n=1 Tax=Molorchus minor TaxID=1323400 RepID=A0ABQ9JWH5_9CUCU|nr:hypothetical protein NQ317_001505 [Molorchus minor]
MVVEMDQKKLQELKALYRETNPNSFLIHISQLTPNLVSRVTNECSESESWHKFVIGNVETYDRNTILQTVLDFVHPLDLLPVMYHRRRQAFFFARNCAEAILKIMSNNLVIPNPKNPNRPLKLFIVANQLDSSKITIDMSDDIANILNKRYDKKYRSLNLYQFYDDEDLKEYVTLSQPKLMQYVLHFILKLNPIPTKIELGSNFIRNVESLRILSSCNLRSLDLSNNQIENLEDLEPLKDLNGLVYIKLDGNPLCDLYSKDEYVARLKQIFPILEIIDGVQVAFDNGFLVSQKNFLCNLSGADLVSQFVEYFFTVYDSEDRSDIAGLYDVNAMFSVTATIIPDQLTTKSATKLTNYLCINRNLHPLLFSSENRNKLYLGRANIMRIFRVFPRTNHDYLGLQCDLISYTPRRAILVVHGVVLEGLEKINFTRMFVLKSDGDNAYSIVNDQLHVSNALTLQARFCHKYPPNVELTRNPLPFYNRQYAQLTETVRSLTELNYDYCQRFLDIFNYDLKKVLTYFVKLHQENLLPHEAFFETRTEPLFDQQKPPIPEALEAKTKMRFQLVTESSVWATANEARLLANLRVTELSTTEVLELLRESKKEPAPIPQNVLTEEDLHFFDEEEMAEYIKEVQGGGGSRMSSQEGLQNFYEEFATTSNEQPGPSTQAIGSSTATTNEPLSKQFHRTKNLFQKQKRAALKFQKQTLLNPPKENLDGTPLDPDAYLHMFREPEKLEIVKKKDIADILVKTLSTGPNPPLPGRIRTRNRRKKNKQKETNTTNISVIKQQYIF